VEQHVSVMMGDVAGMIRIGSFLSKSAKAGVGFTLVLYFCFSS